MRIWDISPGYLNRGSLLGEHRELHGLVSVLVNNKKGYSKHPETLRWAGAEKALYIRHAQLAAEMRLRGYNEKSPLDMGLFLDINKYKNFADIWKNTIWPRVYIDSPSNQFNILNKKYIDKEAGRIPIPIGLSDLWAHHKYSIMARDMDLYRQIGRDIAAKKTKTESERLFESLSQVLTENLRKPPSPGMVINTLQHMWGHVSKGAALESRAAVKSASTAPLEILRIIQREASVQGEKYILSSAALSDLEAGLLQD